MCASAIARVPDRVVLADDQVVWTSALVQIGLLELFALRIERGDVVTRLADEPHDAVAIQVGVARAGVLPGYGPVVDLRIGQRLRGCDAGQYGSDES